MHKRYLGVFLATTGLALLIASALGAGAAPGGSPTGNVLAALSFGAIPGDTHGTAVSDAVGGAIASSTPGVDRGATVSLAACLAAHDRSTLPPGAQAAPGQQENEAKVCATATLVPDDLAAEEPTATPTAALIAVAATATPTHGQTVRDAVHSAIASATPGASRGAAVSEAACTAAHDRTTLPQGAQDAPGRQEAEPKDCTHPSSIAATEPTVATEVTTTAAGVGGGNGNGRGNASANGNGGGRP